MLLWTWAMEVLHLLQRQKLPCRYVGRVCAVAEFLSPRARLCEALLHMCSAFCTAGKPRQPCLGSPQTTGSEDTICDLQRRIGGNSNDPLAWEMLGYLHTLKGNDAAATEALGKCVVSSR